MIINNNSVKIEQKIIKEKQARKSLRDFAGIFSSDPDFPLVLNDIEIRRKELDLEMMEYYRQLDLESEENC